MPDPRIVCAYCGQDMEVDYPSVYPGTSDRVAEVTHCCTPENSEMSVQESTESIFRLIEFSETYGEPEDETGIVNLIADYLHYAHAQGYDTDAVIRMATGHFNEEQREAAGKL